MHSLSLELGQNLTHATAGARAAPPGAHAAVGCRELAPPQVLVPRAHAGGSRRHRGSPPEGIAGGSPPEGLAGTCRLRCSRGPRHPGGAHAERSRWELTLPQGLAGGARAAPSKGLAPVPHRSQDPLESEESVEEVSMDIVEGEANEPEFITAIATDGSGWKLTYYAWKRVRHFRTKYGALEVMLGKSGFAWDDTRKMLRCEKRQYDDHCKKNHEAKGLYGIAFPYYDTLAAIYGRDIATGEGAEGVAEAMSNMEKEIALEDVQDQDDVEERACIETPRRSVDSTSSCSKKRKKDNVKLKDSSSGDRFLDMFVDVQGELKSVCKNVGTMAESMMREAEVQEKIVSEEDTQQKLQNRAILEL
ncbi:hypothetical protein GUJ93_ZPchr0014g47150 [Zizania palustris]|uniref:Myb/SANT-like domain-containing protein n=1 Tax=Zizania palustris TaxID=103762 RepID=A0A8J5T7J5_ZIZPA|nr:hypothetical protein GUJ93_ZPchr0014g47150 [Zizania palustris]